ncbi:MAG: PEGA domain-containing protein [Bacteroidaceae bacterium]|nr:PEGA domain-containing protein [Bacteroidaceae bacterium]
MFKKIFLSLAFLLIAVALGAQSLSVESFRLLDNDLTANTAGTMKRDQNGDVAALIRVVTSEKGFVFDGGMMGIVSTTQDVGEILVYVPGGIQKITVKHDQLGVLRDYYFPVPIEKGRTYEIKLVSGTVHTIVEQAVTSQFVVFSVNPVNAVVYFDDESEAHALDSDGMLSLRLPIGKHNYRVSAPSYMQEWGTFEVKDSKVVQTVSLQSAMASLTVSAQGNAEIWINDKLQGTGNCTVSLESGIYLIEARKASHRTVSQEITLSKQEKRSIELAAPEPIYGKAEITSTPLMCDVYIDGKLAGQTPDLFDKLLVGNHSLVIKKSGYADYESQLSILEGHTAQLSCTLTEGQKHEYVDLGLSVKWATCNVGATKPEEYGDYFAWGETQPKSDYSWPTYKYCKGSSATMTKYCTDSSYGYNGFTDNNSVLDPEDDAAHVNWGGDWRMPTKAEQDELRNTSNCTWTWTTMNGVNGYKVVSKKSGYAGNYIFLPAAGFRYDTTLYSVGSRGVYWSSSLVASSPTYAYSLCFYSGNVDWYNSGRRYGGHSVRPVCP